MTKRYKNLISILYMIKTMEGKYFSLKLISKSSKILKKYSMKIKPSLLISKPKESLIILGINLTSASIRPKRILKGMNTSASYFPNTTISSRRKANNKLISMWKCARRWRMSTCNKNNLKNHIKRELLNVFLPKLLNVINRLQDIFRIWISGSSIKPLLEISPKPINSSVTVSTNSSLTSSIPKSFRAEFKTK